MAVLGTTTLTGCNSIPDFIATGTVMTFQQTTAPTSWTKLTSHDNKALRVVSGTASSGGTTAFTSVFTSRTPAGSVSVSGSNSGGSVSNTTLSSSEIPSHSHGMQQNTFGGSSPAGGDGTFADTWSGGSFLRVVNLSNMFTTNTGGSGAHGHGFSNPSWSGSASFSGSSMDFNVQYVDIILASKN